MNSLLWYAALGAAALIYGAAAALGAFLDAFSHENVRHRRKHIPEQEHDEAEEQEPEPVEAVVDQEEEWEGWLSEENRPKWRAKA